jgi:uncharacterized protein with GYD domain
MLFHVTITHDAAHCPGFNRDLLARTIDSLHNLQTTADKFGVKVHGLYNALPDHVEYLVCEADNNAALAAYLGESLPYGQADTKTHAVVEADELLAAAQAIAPQAR